LFIAWQEVQYCFQSFWPFSGVTSAKTSAESKRIIKKEKNLQKLDIFFFRPHTKTTGLIGTYFLRVQIYITKSYVGNYLKNK
jgi:hypothetical protein